MLLLLLACTAEPVPETMDYEAPGEHAVGARTLSLSDEARGRELTLELWYPATEAGGGSVLDFLDQAQSAQYQELLASAPAGCPSETTGALRGAPLAAGEHPLVLFSHCHECTRFSSFTVAERLASHGFVVAAVDHAGNTLFDPGAELTGEFLATRAADQRFALDVLLGEGGLADPDLAAGDLADLELGPVGILGHSFGSATAGLVLQSDERVLSAMGMAAPFDNPVVPGVEIETLERPKLFLIAVEDNSITELGNMLIRQNAEQAPGETWLREVPDAGHWSFSDLAGIHEHFMPGCGSDERQTQPGEPFDYLDLDEARDLAATTATLFFHATLQGDEAAREQLSQWAVAGD